MSYDLTIRNGNLIDGTGAAARPGDVAIQNGQIVAVGEVSGGARREIDAKGMAVTPGFVETDMGLEALRSTGVESFSEVAPGMPFGRVCQPEDVANAVRFLVSDGANYVSGTRLVVHGSGDY